MLEDALKQHGAKAASSWMVGDGVTDVQAGVAAGVLTAYFGPKKCDSRKILDELSLKPDFWGDNLLEFVKFLETHKGNPSHE
jgi:histidinol phosphatase-like enzyme